MSWFTGAKKKAEEFATTAVFAGSNILNGVADRGRGVLAAAKGKAGAALKKAEGSLQRAANAGRQARPANFTKSTQPTSNLNLTRIYNAYPYIPPSIPVTPPSNQVTPTKPLACPPIGKYVTADKVSGYDSECCWKTAPRNPNMQIEGKYLGKYLGKSNKDKVMFELGNARNAQSQLLQQYDSDGDRLVSVACTPPSNSIIGGSRKKHRTLKHRKLRKNKHTLRKKARHMSRTRN
jgi:hypothetical protein